MKELQDIKVGDRVCIVHRGGWTRRITSVQIADAEKVTATQIAAFGVRWIKRGGYRVGSSRGYHADVLRRFTPELEAEAAEDAAINAAERKCRDWAETLNRARGDDAVRLAALLPDATAPAYPTSEGDET